MTLAVAALSVVVPCRNAAMAAWREDARRHRSLAKLCYVCCRVVRALFARGLCEESDDDGPQDSGRTEDCDGTGMGEGDVSEAKDVSNEIDNEEQLLGLKDEAREEHEGDNDGQQEKLRGEEKAHLHESELLAKGVRARVRKLRRKYSETLAQEDRAAYERERDKRFEDCPDHKA